MSILVISVLLTCKMLKNSFGIGPLANVTASCAKFVAVFSAVVIDEHANFDELGQFIGRILLLDTVDTQILHALNSVVFKLFKFHLKQAKANLRVFNLTSRKPKKEVVKAKQKISRRDNEKFQGLFPNNNTNQESKRELVYGYITEHFFNSEF